MKRLVSLVVVIFVLELILQETCAQIFFSKGWRAGKRNALDKPYFEVHPEGENMSPIQTNSDRKLENLSLESGGHRNQAPAGSAKHRYLLLLEKLIALTIAARKAEEDGQSKVQISSLFQPSEKKT